MVLSRLKARAALREAALAVDLVGLQLLARDRQRALREGLRQALSHYRLAGARLVEERVDRLVSVLARLLARAVRGAWSLAISAGLTIRKQRGLSAGAGLYVWGRSHR